MDNPRPVIIDEADRMSLDALETLRDIADIAENPVILIGMGQADKRLMRHRHLFDRFAEIVKFTELSAADVRSIAEQLCEIPISEDGTQWIHSKSTRFRRAILWFYRSEAHAKRNDLKAISAADLKEIEKGLNK
jgi:DNA transposition AAA+ family ATPase